MEGLGGMLLLLSVAGCLLALLIHAIMTLRGMHEKRIYPLLRVKAPDGSVNQVVCSGPDRYRAAPASMGAPSKGRTSVQPCSRKEARKEARKWLPSAN